MISREGYIKETLSQKDELKRTQLKLDTHLERERTLQETMVSAEQISEDMKVAAKKEAGIIIADAEHQAEKIVQNAHQKLVQVVEHMDQRTQRVQFEAQLRVIIESHGKLLETFASTPDRGSFDDNVSYLMKKSGREG